MKHDVLDEEKKEIMLPCVRTRDGTLGSPGEEQVEAVL